MVQCRTSQLRTLTFARQVRVHLVAASLALSGSVFVAVQTSAFRLCHQQHPAALPRFVRWRSDTLFFSSFFIRRFVRAPKRRLRTGPGFIPDRTVMKNTTEAELGAERSASALQ
jgi:hypothetical protein